MSRTFSIISLYFGFCVPLPRSLGSPWSCGSPEIFKPILPSSGRAEVRFSGGVCTGVMVAPAWFMTAWEGASREGAMDACMSFDGCAERGLGSFPGGDESVLVKGVRACIEVAWLGYDILGLAGDNTDNVEAANELADAVRLRRVHARCSSSASECVLL
jgi:hypothetical protein